MKVTKKIVKLTIAILFIAGVAFNVYLSNQNKNATSQVTLENIEALTASAEEEVVECHCETNLFSPNECTALGDEDLCATGDPNVNCDAYDANCDK